MRKTAHRHVRDSLWQSVTISHTRKTALYARLSIAADVFGQVYVQLTARATDACDLTWMTLMRNLWNFDVIGKFCNRNIIFFSEFKTATEKMNRRYLQFYKDRNFDGIAAMYSKDCRFMPAGFPMQKGPKG